MMSRNRSGDKKETNTRAQQELLSSHLISSSQGFYQIWPQPWTSADGSQYSRSVALIRLPCEKLRETKDRPAPLNCRREKVAVLHDDSWKGFDRRPSQADSREAVRREDLPALGSSFVNLRG